jgi:hypothetical protein
MEKCINQRVNNGFFASRRQHRGFGVHIKLRYIAVKATGLNIEQTKYIIKSYI